MNQMNKAMQDLFGKMDEKMMKRKIAEALNMMKNGKQAELAKALERVDKKAVMEKLKTVDQKTIQEMNVNIQEIKKQITPADYEKMKNATDADGRKIVDQIKKILEE